MKLFLSTTLVISSIALVGCVKTIDSNSNTASINQVTGAAIYTLEDVAAHATEDDCWTVVNDTVYDITSLIATHPTPNVTLGCGIDGTDLFVGTNPEGKDHSEEAQAKIAEYEIGEFAK